MTWRWLWFVWRNAFALLHDDAIATAAARMDLLGWVDFIFLFVCIIKSLLWTIGSLSIYSFSLSFSCEMCVEERKGVGVFGLVER